MASVPRAFHLAFRAAGPGIRTVASRRLSAAARETFHQAARRGYTNFGSRAAPRSFAYAYASIAAATILGGTGFVTLHTRPSEAESPKQTVQAKLKQEAKQEVIEFASHSQEDYQAVYDAVAQRFIDDDDYDDGSYAPVVLRLGWHASGTYDAATNTGGSNGATMRFPPEASHAANNGLAHARAFLEPIKQQFPWITYSDLWTLAASCAVQEMGGPIIPWRPGRSDHDESWCTPDGRLPDGAKAQDHLRFIFGRMGFNDEEIVALSGAHAVGRCHIDRSGFDGPWTFSPITFTNEFFRLLVDEGWHERDWKGLRQFQDGGSRSLMMLPTDMALMKDEGFRPVVERYARDQEGFFGDFARVLVKLFELGVPFREGQLGRMEFRRLDEGGD